MANEKFYLGRLFNEKTAKVTADALNYDSADLTTHAVVTGMTGSGKTGLCIAMLEEAALNGIPAIIIDPKGDLTNLLLHFPELLPQDFQPWIDPEVMSAVRTRRRTSRRGSLHLPGATDSRNGALIKARILDLKNSMDFAVYTPGSDSGIPVSVLSSLEAPELDWESNREPCVNAFPALSPPCLAWSA
jgi:hypothetical protein